MPPSGLLLDSVYMEHETGAGHPESASRYTAVTNALTTSGLASKMRPIAAREALDDELALVHTRPYLKMVEQDIAQGAHDLSTGDTALSPKSRDVALRAAGGVLSAVDGILGGGLGSAFCAVRPPGHHATPDRGMGFCIYNNVAVAARYAQRRHGLDRVLIVDWDVHHGNGTQDTFYNDGSVMFFSTHQHPWYPGTGMAQESGAGKGRNLTINCPLAAGAGREEVLGAARSKLLPAASDFKPDLVIVSAGFDSREGDPLGGFRLTDPDFRELTLLIREIADRHAGGRVLSVLEGGYSLAGLAAGVTAHVEALIG